MMVIDMNLHILMVCQPGKFSDAALLPGIYQDEPLDVTQIDLFCLGKIKEIGYGIDEEISEIFFLGTREHERGARVKLAGG